MKAAEVEVVYDGRQQGFCVVPRAQVTASSEHLMLADSFVELISSNNDYLHLSNGKNVTRAVYTGVFLLFTSFVLLFAGLDVESSPKPSPNRWEEYPSSAYLFPLGLICFGCFMLTIFFLCVNDYFLVSRWKNLQVFEKTKIGEFEAANGKTRVLAKHTRRAFFGLCGLFHVFDFRFLVIEQSSQPAPDNVEYQQLINSDNSILENASTYSNAIVSLNKKLSRMKRESAEAKDTLPSA